MRIVAGLFCAVLMLMGCPALAADHITFGLREAAPLVYRQQDGALAGIEYELLTAILQAAGIDMEPVTGSNARLAASLAGGAIDGFAPVVGDVPDGLFLTDSYITYRNVALTLTTRRLTLTRPADLRALRVLAFQRATKVLGPEFAAAVAGSADYREEPTQALQAKGLLYGRYDVLIGDSRVLRYYIDRLLAERGSNSGAIAVQEHDIFAPTHYCAGFRDAAMAQRFNAALRSLQANGIYDAILARHAVIQ